MPIINSPDTNQATEEKNEIDFFKLQIAPEKENLYEKFTTFADNMKNEYMFALNEDLSTRNSDDSEDFVFGNVNISANNKTMFPRAMGGMIDIENEGMKYDSKSDNEKKIFENKIEDFRKHYGPKGTKSGDALEKMGDEIEKYLEKGVTAKMLRVWAEVE